MKDNERLNFSSVSYEAPELPNCVEKIRTGYDYVCWGNNNRYPNEIYDMYMSSSILQSIINGTADYVYGGGIITDYDMVNERGENFEDTVKRCIFDYMIFGGFAIQLMLSGGVIKEIYWLDFQKVRRSEDEKKCYYCDDWGKYNKKYLEYKSWTPDIKSGTCIYYFKGYKTRGVYPIPSYVGAMKSIKISTEISNFHLNNITNGFSSNAIISFNNGEPSEDQKQKIEAAFKEKFCSTANAGSFMLLFNESKDNAAEVARISDDQFDKKYESLSKSVKEDIFIAFRATPTLFGLPNENNGFSKQEYMESFELYNRTVVSGLQGDIEKSFKRLGIILDFKEFSLNNEN